jgi:hypothetical protein
MRRRAMRYERRADIHVAVIQAIRVVAAASDASQPDS